MNKKLAAATIVAGLGIGGFTGTILGTPGVSSAQTTSSTVTPTASAPAATGTVDPAAKPKPFADAIAGLVKDGTLTQAQADTVTAALVAARPAGDGRGGKGGAGRGMGLDAAATALGMTAADLRTAVQGGQTIAQVATSKGVDLQKVVDAIVADYKTKEQAEVATGDHTQAEVDAKVADFTTKVTDMVNGKLPVGGKDGGGRGPRGAAPTTAPAAASAVAA
jgi:hypothetical protein